MSGRSPARQALKKGIREAVEDSPYVTKEEAEEMVEQVSESFTVEELRETLPREIFEQVMEQLNLDGGEEVGKSVALAESLYDDGTVEKTGGVGASHHLNGEDPFEEPEVEVSKSTEHRLGKFYEKVEEE